MDEATLNELEARIQIAMNLGRQAEIAIAALSEIAAQSDKTAWDHYAKNGSWAMFDEPGAVQTAAEVLARCGELGKEIQPILDRLKAIAA